MTEETRSIDFDYNFLGAKYSVEFKFSVPDEIHPGIHDFIGCEADKCVPVDMNVEGPDGMDWSMEFGYLFTHHRKKILDIIREEASRLLQKKFNDERADNE